MGLDVYVRFGEIGKDEDGYEEFVGWHEKDGEYRDRYEDQMTGFTSAPYAGYLRESWGSLRAVSEMAKELDAPMPYEFFEDWNGNNGEHLSLANGNFEKLIAYRDDVLRPWIRRNDEAKAAIEKVLEGLSPDDRSKKYGTIEIFTRRIADTIGFINFIELHKDKKNLTVVFG